MNFLDFGIGFACGSIGIFVLHWLIEREVQARTSYRNRVGGAEKARTARAQSIELIEGVEITPETLKSIVPNATDAQLEQLVIAANSPLGKMAIKKLLREAGIIG